MATATRKPRKPTEPKASVRYHKDLETEIRVQVTTKDAEVPLLLKAVDLKMAGQKWADIKRQINIQHSKLDRAWYLQGILTECPEELVRREFGTWPEARQQAFVADLRNRGLSWGQVSLRVGLTEGATQTRFEAATGLSAQGTRNGRGGRYFDGEERYYEGNRRKFGVEFDKAQGKPDPAKVVKDAEEATSILASRVAAAKKATGSGRKANARTAKATK
jgi:hypothetical protein